MFRKTFAAALALAALPAVAPAGPIQWSYSFTFGGATGKNWLKVGDERAYIPNWDGTGSPWQYYPTIVPLESWANKTGATEHYAELGLGYTQTSNAVNLYPNPVPGPGYQFDTDWTTTLSITDASSGQSGAFTMTGDGWDGRLWGGPVTKTLTIGDHDYTVTMRVDRYATGSTARAFVTVATPEPGTLILAACGLGLPAAGWVRRRVRG